jgi:CheY-like chemotaxis protein
MPHLVVLDYAMPGMDGVELLGELRALPDADHLRAIVVSSTTDPHARGRFAMLGVRAFANKPIEFGALVETFHTVARQNGWMGVENEG